MRKISSYTAWPIAPLGGAFFRSETRAAGSSFVASCFYYRFSLSLLPLGPHQPKRLGSIGMTGQIQDIAKPRLPALPLGHYFAQDARLCPENLKRSGNVLQQKP